MSEVTATARRPREARNGVNTPVLFATINAVKETPALAKFRFRASSRWIDGTYSESRVESFNGAGAEHTHQTQFGFAADHPGGAWHSCTPRAARRRNVRAWTPPTSTDRRTP